MYANATPASSVAEGRTQSSADKTQFDAQVVRIWSGDQIVGVMSNVLLRLVF